MKKGFTLIEVNLAMLIMAMGVLVMCGLYSLGFRENRQSVEDVAAAAYADTYLGPLMQGLSATNLEWTSWIRIGNQPGNANMRRIADGVLPANGWLAYVRQDGNKGGYRVNGNPKSTADGVWQEIQSQIPSPYKGSLPSIPNDYTYALVATRSGATIQLAFRCARRKESLMTQPLFVSEIHFQGDPER